jgi:hypothetical protein
MINSVRAALLGVARAATGSIASWTSTSAPLAARIRFSDTLVSPDSTTERPR